MKKMLLSLVFVLNSCSPIEVDENAYLDMMTITYQVQCEDEQFNEPILEASIDKASGVTEIKMSGQKIFLTPAYKCIVLETYQIK